MPLSELANRQEAAVNPLAHAPTGSQPPIPAAGPGPPQGAAPHTGMPDEQDAAQQDAEVQQLMDLAEQIIFGGDTPEGEVNGPIMQLLRSGSETGGSNPSQILGTGAALVISRAVADMPQPPDGSSAFLAMLNVLGELAEVAEAEGLFAFREEEMEDAVMFASQQLYSMSPELFPQEEMAQDSEVLQRAYDDGSLDRDLTDLMAQVQAA